VVGEESGPLRKGARLGRRPLQQQERRGTRAGEEKDAGLPDTNLRDPHKPGESPALQGTRGRDKFFEKCGLVGT
jgi:hypothetical protein